MEGIHHLAELEAYLFDVAGAIEAEFLQESRRLFVVLSLLFEDGE